MRAAEFRSTLPVPARKPRRSRTTASSAISTASSVQDGGASNPATTTEIINNTFAYNTTGLTADNTAATGSEQAYVANNIFWQNHDQTTARNGLGVYSQTVNKLVLNNNLFSGNGPSDTSTAYAAVNIGNGFDPTKLGPLAANAAADLGNFTGYPAFVAPRDPRQVRVRRTGHVLPRRQFRAALDLGRDQQRARERGHQDGFPGQPREPQPDHRGVPSARIRPPRCRRLRVRATTDADTYSRAAAADHAGAAAPAPTAPPKKKDTAPVKKLKVVASPKPQPKTTTATSISRKPPTFPVKSAKKK